MDTRSEPGTADLQSQMLDGELRQYRATLDALPDLVLELDADGVIRAAHCGAPEDFPVEPPDLIGKSVEQTLSPLREGLARRVMAEVDRLGRSAGHEFRSVNGADPGWYDLTAARRAPIVAGRRPGYVFVIRNITGRIAAGREVQRRHVLLNAMFEKSPLAIALLDLETGACLDVNESLLRESGHARDAFIGVPVVTFIAPDYVPDAQAALEQLARGRAFGPKYLEYIDAQGVSQPISARGVSYTDEDGRALAWLFAEDLTARLQFERDLADKTNEALAARSQLVNAVEALPDGFMYYDADQRMVLCNRSQRGIFPGHEDIFHDGATYSQIVGEVAKRGLIADAIGDPEAWIAQRVAAFGEDQADAEITLSDGRVIRLLEHRTPDGGKVALRTDITALSRIRQRLRAIIEGAGVGTWEWNLTTGSNVINERWAIMLGYRLDELVPMQIDTWRALLHADDLVMARTYLADVLEGRGEQFSYELRVRHKKGHWVRVLSKGRVSQRDAYGKPLAMAGIHLDVTRERLQAEALARTNAELQAALERQKLAEKRFFDIETVSSDWFWEMDSMLRFTYVSPSLEQLTGLRIADHLGKTIAERVAEVPGSETRGDWGALQAKLDAREPFDDFVYHVRERDGDTRWLRMSGNPWFDSEGRFGGYRGVGSDISAIFRDKERAEQASRAKSAFLANMSHELRTPLNGVLGMAELLEQAIADPRHREMVAAIRASGESLLTLLNDLLDMAKIEAGKMTIDDSPFRPRALVDALEPVYAELARRKGLDFTVRAGPGIDTERRGDLYRLQQVLHNLLSNAIKFTESGSVTLSLEARGPDRPLVVEVRDTGIGMNESALARVFEPFEQADGSTTRRFGGTGLGMSIVRNLVDLMGGAIRADSVEGKGTQIRLELPLALSGDGPASPEASDVTLDATALHGLRLLVADDNATNRKILQLILTRAGARSVLVKDGHMAVTAFAARPDAFDLLLLDISMPRLDGIAALSQIRLAAARKNQQVPPAVAITANVMQDQIDEIRASGFDGHVPKPFKAEQLITELRRLVPVAADADPGPGPRE